jgi:glycosyltransferase involved in cell wall biosynthesis
MRAVLVTTTDGGSMDATARALAPHLPAARLELDVDRASAGRWGGRLLAPETARDLAGDLAVIRRLRGTPGLLHLANHHLARYGPWLARPYVVTAHDLIRHADQGDLIARPSRRDRLHLRRERAGLRRAAALVVPSRHTRDQVLRHLRVAPGRVHVVPMGVDHARFRPVSRRLLHDRYLLFVGAEHPRKGLETLLRAFAALRADPRFRELRLVKAGSPGGAPHRERTERALDALGLAHRQVAPDLPSRPAAGERPAVLLVGHTTPDDLAAWYSGAEALVLASRAEGFGLPPLEAMACGCPAVVSTAGALPETAGPAALTVPPDDPAALEAALRRLLTDPPLREDLRARGLEHAAAFSWERTARETWAVYEQVAAELDGPLESAQGGARPKHARATLTGGPRLWS